MFDRQFGFGSQVLSFVLHNHQNPSICIHGNSISCTNSVPRSFPSKAAPVKTKVLKLVEETHLSSYLNHKKKKEPLRVSPYMHIYSTMTGTITSWMFSCRLTQPERGHADADAQMETSNVEQKKIEFNDQIRVRCKTPSRPSVPALTHYFESH